MSYLNNQQEEAPAAVSYPPAAAAAPPPMGYPTKDGPAVGYGCPQQSVLHQTTTRGTEGDGFWKGCCAALCCCCVLDWCCF